MEIRLSDRTVLTSSALLYEVKGTWYLPLVEFSDYLGIRINSKPKATGATGFIIDEKKKFDLDYTGHSVDIGGVTEVFSGDQVIAANSDFYVESKHLSTWLPIEISIDPFKSVVIVNPKEELPVQARARREGELILGRESPVSASSRLEVLKPKEALFDGPFVDAQLDSNKSFSGPGDKGVTSNLQLGASSQVLTFDSSTHLATEDNQLSTLSQTFSRKDPNGNLLGVMHLQQIVLMDLQSPALPLISGGKSARGALISSYPFTFNTYSSQTIEGDLQPGWQVEVFHNEILIGRQNATPEGRYSFKDLTLYYGRNTFKLVFYGPYGQKREQYQSYDIDSSILKSGAHYYRASVFEGPGNRAIGFFQVDQSLSREISLGGSFSRAELRNTHEILNYQGLSMNGFFTGININAAAAFCEDQGKAYEITTKVPISTATAGAKYTLLKKFRSDLFNSSTGNSARIQESQLELDTQFAVPYLPMIQSSIDFLDKRYELDPHPEQSIKNRLTFQKNSWGLNHTANYRFSNPSPFDGEGEISTFFGPTRLRAGIGYDLETLRSFEEEIEVQFDDRYSASFRSNQDVLTKRIEGGATVSRSFPNFAMGVTLAAASTQEFTGGLTLRTSLARDPISRQVRFDASSFTEQGAVSALVFQDVNRNDVFDSGDRPLPGMHLSVDQRKSERATQEDGRLFIPHLSPYQSIGIEIALESLTDPHLRMAKQGARVTPRPGTTLDVQLPLIAVGTVAGIVDRSSRTGNVPEKFVPLELIDTNHAVIKSTRTDAQGIYWLEDVDPGKYFLRIKPEWLESYQLDIEPTLSPIEISGQGDDIQLNLILTPKKKR